MMWRFAVLMPLVLLIAATNCWAGADDDTKRDSTAKQDKQTPQKASFTITYTVDYLLYLPPKYDEKEEWPLVLFLHGAGERGADLELVKKHGPPKRVAQGKEFPFILVSPQCPQWHHWNARVLAKLLDQIEENYNVDSDRIYVTGLSMGGFGTWDMALRYPKRFAAIAPICGGGDPERAGRIAQLPVWVFHGAKDPAVPVKRAKEMVKALQEAGGHPKLTIYPEAGHDSWTKTYDNPEFYKWLLGQERDGDEEKG